MSDGRFSFYNYIFGEDIYLRKFGLVTAEEKATNAILRSIVIVILDKSVPKTS